MTVIRAIIAALLAILAALIVSASVLIERDAAVSAVPDTDVTVPSETTAAPETTAVPETTEVPETSSSPEDTTGAPETTAAPLPKEYDYSLPVPASAPVGKEFFDDAIFIGNSRTRGFLTQAGLSKPGAYAYVGLTVDRVFTEPIVPKGDKKITVIDAIRADGDFSKAYIMLGTNEIGWLNNEVYVERYGAIIDELRRVNPDVEIYIQSVLPVSSVYTPEHPEYYMYNMPKINTYNALLRTLAEQKKVYFVNVAEIMTDADGYLFDGASRDGVHINRDYCKLWLEYLMCHTVGGTN